MKTRGTIRAELVGFTECRAMDVVAHSYAPVPLLAKRLLDAGVNPDRALAVYQGQVLTLWFPSLAAAAKTRIKIRT